MTIRNNFGLLRQAMFSFRLAEIRCAVTLAACCLIGISLSGCAAPGNMYTHKTIPQQLVAGTRDNVQTLDLTRLARASTNSDVIDKGDVIEVSISANLNEKDNVTLPVRVNDSGMAELPEIGPILLAGLNMESAEAAIVAVCIERQLYRRPNVTVTMKRQRTNRVMVVGAVKNPDVYELPRGRSDLLAAIVAAGGLEDDAGTKVEIRNPRISEGGRGTPVATAPGADVDMVGHSNILMAPDSAAAGEGGLDAIPVADSNSMDSIKVDLVSATKSGTGNYQLLDGGVVSIETRDPEPLHVLGLVHRPNRYDFPIAEDLRVTDAIALAGGTSMPVADKIFVVRRVPKSSETAVIQVSLRTAKRDASANLRLEPGDVVSVENTPATIMYEAINFMRFNLSAGLPLAGVF